MFQAINRTPRVIFHYTKRANLGAIQHDGRLKRFRDPAVWVCETYPDILEQIKITLCNPEYQYYDLDGTLQKRGNVNLEDYVIIKARPVFNQPQNWFTWIAHIPPEAIGMRLINPYEHALAYQGNLRIQILDVLSIPPDIN